MTITRIPVGFEDGSYPPVRGSRSCIARTACGRPLLGSQHPRSPTNCFDRDHRSHSQPAPLPSSRARPGLGGHRVPSVAHRVFHRHAVRLHRDGGGSRRVWLARIGPGGEAQSATTGAREYPSPLKIAAPATRKIARTAPPHDVETPANNSFPLDTFATRIYVWGVGFPCRTRAGIGGIGGLLERPRERA